MVNTTEELTNKLKKHLRYIGLDIFNHIEILQHPDSVDQFRLQLGLDIELSGIRLNESIESVSDQIMKSIEESDNFSRIIISLKSRIDNLEEEVKELNEYKIFYEMYRSLK